MRKNAQKFKDIKIDIIYSSDFLRTKQTAEIFNEVAQTELVFDKCFSQKCGIVDEGCSRRGDLSTS